MPGESHHRRTGLTGREKTVIHLEKGQWIRIVCCALAVIAAVLYLCGILGGKPLTYRISDAETPAARLVILPGAGTEA